MRRKQFIERREENFYRPTRQESLLEDDELSYEEEGFMHGYIDASEEEVV